MSQVPVKRKMEFDLATCRYVWGFDIKKDVKQGKGVPATLTKVDKVKGAGTPNADTFQAVCFISFHSSFSFLIYASYSATGTEYIFFGYKFCCHYTKTFSNLDY